MKSKLSTLKGSMRVSGHYCTGEELNEEIYDKWINIGYTGNKDLVLFYCWLEWNEIQDQCAWLSRFDGSSVDEYAQQKKKNKQKKDSIQNTMNAAVQVLHDLTDMNKEGSVHDNMDLLTSIINCPYTEVPMKEEAKGLLLSLKKDAMAKIRIGNLHSTRPVQSSSSGSQHS